MRAGKKESIGVLIGAMAEAESKSFYDDTEAVTSDLKSLLNIFLKKDSSSERVQILKDYESGAPLTGKGGIRQRLGAIDMEFFGRAYFPHYFSRPSPEFHRELDNIWQQGVLKGEYPTTPAKVKKISRMNGTKRVVAAPRGHAKSTSLTFKGSIHAIVYEYKHYPIIISDSSEQAEGFLDNIRVEFEENEALKEDFGSLVGKVWRSNVLITSTNIKVEAIGSGKKIRGRKHRNWRPDLLVLDDIENELGIATCPINWPIGSGKDFKGVYDRNTKKVMTFSDTLKGTKEGEQKEIDIDDPALKEELGEDYWSQLMDEIELLDGASAEFDQDMVSKGELSPVFFGSALTNFGVETFLQHFLKMTYSPLPRNSDIGPIDPFSEDFSAFVFKIQANMNKAHRDRIAFMRICSGKFEAGMEVMHIQGGKKIRLAQPQQMMAQERHMVEEAYAGDIIGVFDPGIFSIGDTIETSAKPFRYEGIPTFAPEHFARVRQVDTMKRKQFVKGITQIAQEGAIQIFQEYHTGMEEIIVGVVGVLQFDVLKYRLENEYNVEIHMENLPYEHIRWIKNKELDLDKLTGTSDMKKIQDLKGNPLLLFVNAWSVGMVLDRNEGLELEEFGRD